MATNPGLSVVIPVFNEEKNITSLIKDWQEVVNDIGVPYRLILVNDGSTDKSLDFIRSMAATNPRIHIHSQQNAGHGPSIYKGYQLALEDGEEEWIFQIDSDHQLDTGAFRILWRNRERHDFLLGERKEKIATLARKCVSFSSWLIVGLLYGTRVKDVNSPYRLMRAEKLREAINTIPGKSFAPNILLTSWFVFSKTNIFTTTVSLREKAIARQSKMSLYMMKGCLQSIFQTIHYRFSIPAGKRKVNLNRREIKESPSQTPEK